MVTKPNTLGIFTTCSPVELKLFSSWIDREACLVIVIRTCLQILQVMQLIKMLTITFTVDLTDYIYVFGRTVLHIVITNF